MTYLILFISLCTFILLMSWLSRWSRHSGCSWTLLWGWIGWFSICHVSYQKSKGKSTCQHVDPFWSERKDACGRDAANQHYTFRCVDLHLSCDYFWWADSPILTLSPWVRQRLTSKPERVSIRITLTEHLKHQSCFHAHLCSCHALKSRSNIMVKHSLSFSGLYVCVCTLWF